MIKIVIDARIWGIEHTGPGRYTENISKKLLELDQEDQFFFIVRPGDKPDISRELQTAETVPVEARHYSFYEQLALPLALIKIRPNLLHVPHFNIPVFWPGKLVVTIHDLITHEFRGREETTLPLPVYWFKYVVHRAVMTLAVKRASAVIVPSRWVKNSVVIKYHLPQGKVFPVYEGVAPFFFKCRSQDLARVRRKYHLPKRFLIYTGNAYAHKNLARLFTAVRAVNVPLAIVCARSVFRERLEESARASGAEKLISFLGAVPDKDLCSLYRASLAYVTASLSEGFGLPALEAMAAGTIILSSSATCLPEIYGDVPVYFDPLKTEEIIVSIKKIMQYTISQRRSAIRNGKKHAAKFTWEEAARLTLDAYHYAIGH